MPTLVRALLRVTVLVGVVLGSAAALAPELVADGRAVGPGSAGETAGASDVVVPDGAEPEVDERAPGLDRSVRARVRFSSDDDGTSVSVAAIGLLVLRARPESSRPTRVLPASARPPGDRAPPRLAVS